MDAQGTASIGTSPALAAIGGEFRDPAVERRFLGDRFAETVRHARQLLFAAVILNSLFLVSDWRFAGTPHFWVAVPARLIVVGLALIFLLGVGRCRDPRRLQAITGGWMALNALAVAALVTSHSSIALFVVIMLPAIYYLVVPTRFRWTLAGGMGTSILLLLAYGEHHVAVSSTVGLALAMVTLNCGLLIAVTRANRLDRQAWVAIEGERQLRRELAASREGLERMFAASPVPLALTAEDGRILRLSDSCAALFGLAGADRPRLSLHDFVPAERRERRAAIPVERETAARLKGEDRVLLVKAAHFEIAGAPVTISGIVDITDRKHAERRLERMAHTDGLTGLLNRTSFFAGAPGTIAQMRRERQGLSLLMVDIDHFKAVNDGFGHQAGDAVLRAFATVCRDAMPGSALVARLGGEEFGVLLPDTGLRAAGAIAERLRGRIEALRIDTGDATIAITVSIGVAAVRADDALLDNALRRADLALYAAKRAGRNRAISETDPAVGDAIRANG